MTCEVRKVRAARAATRAALVDAPPVRRQHRPINTPVDVTSHRVSALDETWVDKVQSATCDSARQVGCHRPVGRIRRN